MADSLGRGELTYACEKCPGEVRAARSCPEPAEEPIETCHLECSREYVPLVTCPRNHAFRRPWVAEVVWLARHYRAHDVLPRGGGLLDQEHRTMRAIEIVIGAWDTLEEKRLRARAAGASEMPADAPAPVIVP